MEDIVYLIEDPNPSHPEYAGLEKHIYIYEDGKKFRLMRSYGYCCFKKGIEYRKLKEISRDTLIYYLTNIESLVGGDQEDWHAMADDLLCLYINDKEIVEAYSNVEKWYA
jgi:hypothetical protein